MAAIFRDLASGAEFSAYDAEGVPTHDKDGNALPKSAIKKLAKDLEFLGGTNHHQTTNIPLEGTPDVSPTVYEGILSFWGLGEVWGIFPGYVDKIIETTIKQWWTIFFPGDSKSTSYF